MAIQGNANSMSQGKLLQCWGFLLVLPCLVGATCTPGSSGLLGLRSPPVIIPAGASPDLLSMTFTVDLRSYPEAAKLAWEFGDESATPTMPVAQGRTVTHTFTSTGVFNVQVYVFDGGDPVQGSLPRKVATGFLPVEVTGPNALPAASFQTLDVRDASNQLIPTSKKFVATASRDPDGTIAKYAWEFGDETMGDGQTVQHDYAVGGRYTVRLTVTDNRGGTADTTRSVLVNAPPTANYTFTFGGADQLTVTFDGSSSADPDGTILQYQWNFGDVQTGTGQQVSHTYLTPGPYTASLTVTDNSGATATFQQSVRVSGIELFVRSVTPNFGVVNTTVSDVQILGENFTDSGLTVRLVRATQTINATSVRFIDSSEIAVAFDLNGATLGDYEVVVALRSGTPGRLANGFRVGTSNRVRLTTTMGDIVMEMVGDAPLSTANFLQYVQDGFYDGTIFHRIIADFVIQGGGFLPGLVAPPGLQGPIQNEFSPTRSNVRGTVAMAKLGSDPNSATSQWFVNLKDNSANLDSQNGGFTVFANVVEGMDIVDAIAAVPVDANDQPVTDVVVTTARRE